MTEQQVKSKAISGTLWKLAERIGAQLVSMIVSILLARILVPEDYSVVSIVAIFFSFCNIFITSGLSSGLVQQKEADELDFSSVLFANLGLAAALYLIVFFAAPYIAKLYEMPILIPVIRVMGLNFFVYMVKSVVSAKISRTLEFKKFFLATIVGTAISAVVGIAMAYNGMGAWALVAQQSTNAIIDTILLIVVTKIKFVFRFSFKRLKPIIKYSWKILATNFVGTIYAELKPLIVGIKYSTVNLAYFNKGENFPKTISSSLEGTLSAVLFPAISRVNNDGDAVLRFSRKFFKVSSYLIFPAMLGLMGVGENFIKVILTDKWMPILPFFQIFCLYYMLYFITLGCGQIYKAIGQSGLLLKLEIAKKTISLVILFLFVVFSSSVVVFALATIVTIVTVLIIDSIMLKKYIGYKFRYQLKDFLSNLIISIIMFIAVYFVGQLKLNIYVGLAAQIAVGIIVYLILSIITKNENFGFCLNMVKSFFKGKIKKNVEAE